MLRALIKPYYLDIRQAILQALVRSGPPPAIPSAIRSLLVITDRRLGDISLAIPIIQCLRAAYPSANFAIVTPGLLQPLVRWACQPNHLFDIDDNDAISNTNWDMVIDLTTDYHLRAARLAAGTHSKVRIGFEFKGRGCYFNLPLEMTETEHMQQTYSRVLAAPGIPFRQLPLPALLPADPVKEWKPHAVAIHPGAHHETQRWPAEYFADLIRRIHDDRGVCVVLGAENERELVEKIAKLAGSGATVGITSNVMQLAATLRASEMLICNNSGPLHLAGLLGVSTLSFMGPTVKRRWSPLGPGAVVLRQDDLPCIGCNLGYCRIQTHACMRDIRPEEAFAAFCRLRAVNRLGSSS